MRELPLPTLPLANLRLHLHGSPPPAAPRAARDPVERFSVTWAKHPNEIREAQRLRYRVFAEEMGAQLSPPPGTPSGLDIDRFDAHCEHLIVRCEDDSAQAGEVIGTYRVLTPDTAQRLGSWYSDTEFDLGPLRALLGRTAELGRSCVHPAHRQGGVILALWGALGAFLRSNRLDTVIGCASVAMHDGGHVAASLWERLRTTHLAAAELQVRPRLALPIEDLRRDLPAELPALIKGYLRCGAKVLGAPAWDPDFNTADLPMMMRLQDLPEKYRRHFLAN
jgi:putative hemolysin